MIKKYEHILLPLDGSALAEVAMLDAESIAKFYNAEITLLRVLPPINDIIKVDNHLVFYIDEQMENRKIRSSEYLNSISDKLKKESITSHTVVEVGHPEEIIVDYTSKNSIDIIVMATHGRTGMKRWVYGSVADKVLKSASVPILLCRSYT